MKVPAYDVRNPKGDRLEVYKLQASIFSIDDCKTVLIYNEDRTQQWEEDKPNNVKVLLDFMGKGVIKCYACGFQNEKGQIILVDKVEDQKYWFK